MRVLTESDRLLVVNAHQMLQLAIPDRKHVHGLPQHNAIASAPTHAHMFFTGARRATQRRNPHRNTRTEHGKHVRQNAFFVWSEESRTARLRKS